MDMHDPFDTKVMVRLAVVLAMAAAGIMGVAAGRAAADAWSDANCRNGTSLPDHWKRSSAASYAQPPVDEGYSLNGGCYKLNDRDDTPSLPADGGGEGADCSGFVFRVWALKSDGTNGYKRYDYKMDIHGPWYSWNYKDPKDGDPFRNIPKTDLSIDRMDAIAWYRDGGDDRHIALIWQEGSRSDLYVHAHSNTDGTEISEEIYRQISDTEATQRRNWSLECEPRCPTPTTKPVPGA
jgi:hypothetical protein